jgi:hypothetical protein
VEVLEMLKRKNPTAGRQRDALLPLVQKMDRLWAEYLADVLWRHNDDNAYRTRAVEQLFTRPIVADSESSGKPQLLHVSVPLNDVINASLVFYELGDDPLDPEGMQHRVQCCMMSLYRFLWDSALGEIEIDGAEIRRQRDAFFNIRDLVGSVRYALANGQHDGLEGVVATPRLNEKAWRAGECIRKNRGITGDAIAAEINVSSEYFRGPLYKMLKHFGFRNLSGTNQGNGYYHDRRGRWPKWPNSWPPV